MAATAKLENLTGQLKALKAKVAEERARVRDGSLRSRHDEGLIRVIESVGSLRRLSELLGGRVSHQAIGQWRRVPADWLVDIEKVTGIPRHEIWPELYEGYVKARGK